MRTYHFSIRELDFIAKLGFYDLKQFATKRLTGEFDEMRSRFGPATKVTEEFELNMRECYYVSEMFIKWHNEDNK